MKASIVKAFAVLGFGYIAYNVANTIYMEKMLKEAKIIREYR